MIDDLEKISSQVKVDKVTLFKVAFDCEDCGSDNRLFVQGEGNLGEKKGVILYNCDSCGKGYYVEVLSGMVYRNGVGLEFDKRAQKMAREIVEFCRVEDSGEPKSQPKYTPEVYNGVLGEIFVDIHP